MSIREHTSMTNVTQAETAQVRTSVTSAIHSWYGAVP
jgi:hypothetical protein